MNNHEAKFSLLLVDDEPSVLSLLRQVFSKMDYHIHTAIDGQDALNLLGEKRINAALIDWKMPLSVWKTTYGQVMSGNLKTQ